MYKKALCFWAVFALLSLSVSAQSPAPQDSFQKNFKKFAGIVSRVDFYASERALITPFEKPIAAGLDRLKSMLGPTLTDGAVVICKSNAERDAVAEERVLRYGYKWALIQLSPLAEQEQQLEQIKARMGGQIPPEFLARMQQQQRTPEQNAAMWSRTASALVVRMSSAILQTLLNPEKQFRGSRLDDHTRSPLFDWIDVGLTRYASDSIPSSIRWTQDHLEDMFPIEDMLQMNRPFVLPDAIATGGGGGGRGVNSGGGGNGQQMIIVGGPGGMAGGGMGMPGAGAPDSSGGTRGGDGTRTGGGGGGGRGGGRGESNMPKEQLDRQNFDNQSALFFAYLIEKLGLDKTRQLVQLNREEKDPVKAILSPEFLGKSFDALEKDFVEWVKIQKAPQQQMFRMTTGGN